MSVKFQLEDGESMKFQLCIIDPNYSKMIRTILGGSTLTTMSK